MSFKNPRFEDRKQHNIYLKIHSNFKYHLNDKFWKKVMTENIEETRTLFNQWCWQDTVDDKDVNFLLI